MCKRDVDHSLWFWLATALALIAIIITSIFMRAFFPVLFSPSDLFLFINSIFSESAVGMRLPGNIISFLIWLANNGRLAYFYFYFFFRVGLLVNAFVNSGFYLKIPSLSLTDIHLALKGCTFRGGPLAVLKFVNGQEIGIIGFRFSIHFNPDGPISS